MLPYVHIGIFFLITAGFGALMVVLSSLLGPRNRGRSDLTVYECGVIPVETSRNRFDVKFYLIAILFLLFDLEVIFLFPWALMFRELSLFGPTMLIEMGIFVGVLLLGLFYIWKKDLLNWH